MLTKAELQRLRSLREKKNREAAGLFVVEGGKVVAELLTAGCPLLEIYATAEWSAPGTLNRGSGGPRCIEITAQEMARASHFPTPSSVLAVGRIESRALEAGAIDQGLTLALDGLQDAGNVGTLMRIADWFGFDRVLLSADCADLFHQKVINASMGSFALMPTFRVDLPTVLASAAGGTPILGCDLEGTPLASVPGRPNTVVVIGSEGRGLSPAVSARITERITIPRFGRAESLNAGVAAGIVCAHLRRAI